MARGGRDAKVVVLKMVLDEEGARKAVERKKTKPFSMLFGPGRDDIHAHEPRLHYECLLRASGRYAADYYRHARHTISVDSNVSEVVLKGGTFQVRPKSRLEKVFVGKKGRNKVDLELDEHVHVETEETLTFDHHGKESKFPYKTGPGAVENYPERLLEETEAKIRRTEMTHGEVVRRLKARLKDGMEDGVRDLKEEFEVDMIAEVYVPVYEARLVGPKKKVAILRIDAARNRVI